MHWPHWLPYQNCKVLTEVLETWQICTHLGQKNRNPPKFGFPSTEKICWKSGLFSITSPITDPIETGFSLNNRPKRAENTSGWHHARSCHLFLGILLNHISLFRNKTVFLKNQMFSIHWKKRPILVMALDGKRWRSKKVNTDH